MATVLTNLAVVARMDLHVREAGKDLEIGFVMKDPRSSSYGDGGY